VRFSPSDVLSGLLAVGLATAEVASHHTSFTLNNLVRVALWLPRLWEPCGVHACCRQPQQRPPTQPALQRLRARCPRGVHARTPCRANRLPFCKTQTHTHTHTPARARARARAHQVACLVATEILALVGLRSFRTAAVLLLGLLCYDVFFVFATPTGAEWLCV
jgi:hypothetical protein